MRKNLRGRQRPQLGINISREGVPFNASQSVIPKYCICQGFNRKSRDIMAPATQL